MLNIKERDRGEVLSFCKGLPFVEDRPLLLQDRAKLDSLAKRLTAQGIVIFLALLLGGIFLVAALFCLSSYWNAALLVAAILVAILLVLLPASLSAHGWPLQRGLLLFKDLRRGFVREFRGESDAGTEENETFVELFHGTERRGIIALEVLPVSQRLWRVDGREVTRWIEAPWIDVAMPPSQTTERGPLLEFAPQRRPLSRSEQQELRRHIRSMLMVPLSLVLISVTLFVCVLFQAMGSGGIFLHPSHWVSVLPTGLLALQIIVCSIPPFKATRGMRQDGRLGYVERTSSSTGGTEGFIEALPISGTPWSQNGVPAIWRRISMTEGRQLDTKSDSDANPKDNHTNEGDAWNSEEGPVGSI